MFFGEATCLLVFWYNKCCGLRPAVGDDERSGDEERGQQDDVASLLASPVPDFMSPSTRSLANMGAAEDRSSFVAKTQAGKCGGLFFSFFHFCMRPNPTFTCARKPQLDEIYMTTDTSAEESLVGWYDGFICLVPACCDILGTSLSGIGLLYVSPSLYQMLRGAIIIFTSLFRYLFLGQSQTKKQLVGLALTVVGVSFAQSEVNLNRKKNETHETLLARARRCAPPRARWTGNYCRNVICSVEADAHRRANQQHNEFDRRWKQRLSVKGSAGQYIDPLFAGNICHAVYRGGNLSQTPQAPGRVCRRDGGHLGSDHDVWCSDSALSPSRC